MSAESKTQWPLLVVEDSDVDYEAFLRSAAKAGIPNPICRCENGDKALDFLYAKNTIRPLIILLDLNLPGTHGLDVLRTIKTDPKLQSIPTLILSSSEHPADVSAAYKAGANTYMVKPTLASNLLKLLETLKNYWLGRDVLIEDSNPTFEVW